MRREHLLVVSGILFLFVTLPFIVSSAYGPPLDTDQYTLSRSKVDRLIEEQELFTDTLTIMNKQDRQLQVSFSAAGEAASLISFDESGVVIPPREEVTTTFLVQGTSEGEYLGSLSLQGDIVQTIPVNISVVIDAPDPTLLMEIEPTSSRPYLERPLEINVILHLLQSQPLSNVTLTYALQNASNDTIPLGEEMRDISSSLRFVKEFSAPETVDVGYYTLITTIDFSNETLSLQEQLYFRHTFWNISVFGLFPLWILLLFLGVLFSGALAFFLIRRHLESKKKYKMRLDLSSLPKKNPEFLYLGKIAERKEDAFLDPGRLTTHSIVAGATGGGKSISAQVIVEEALMHNIAVIVMDPTAQWSGMLRKCTDKKMMSFYPNFGLKETDSRAFKGNVRMVKDARQIIDINKYATPGQIQIFSLNKLDPKDMDIFVANVIRQIFRNDPKEHPTLKTLIVFDEVHRLLSKFGGSGEGFLQVERACREFRKWGLGVMLVSQVLADFVGEIKANISTEVQMRTRDEGDLGRIKTKYGEEFLQSLVKASVGVGMFVNPAYNHAQPYFVNFRPILHNTRRLTDEELEKYNAFNDKVDDLEYQIQQLEEEKVDTFDLKMELKLVKDKIMTGNFSVVEIYLEGLTPRVEKEWEKLGKKPKKLELELVDEAELKASIEEAKKSHDKAQKAEADAAAAEKEGEEKKADIGEKQVKALTFDNGVMISSLNELKGMLPTMDQDIFSTHVNKEKHDIGTWVTENFGEEEGKKISALLDKNEILKALEGIGKEEKPAPEKKADSGKKEGNASSEKKKATDSSTTSAPEGEKKSEEKKEEKPAPEKKEASTGEGKEDSSEKKES